MIKKTKTKKQKKKTYFGYKKTHTQGHHKFYFKEYEKYLKKNQINLNHICTG